MPSILEVDFAQPEGFRPLSLDLRTPDVDGAPIVVFLHGGGWLRGNRKEGDVSAPARRRGRTGVKTG